MESVFNQSTTAPFDFAPAVGCHCGRPVLPAQLIHQRARGKSFLCSSCELGELIDQFEEYEGQK